MAKIKGKWIEDATIPETKLDIDNDPANDEVLTYDSTAGKPKWQLPPNPDTHDIRVTASDTTPGFLDGKLVVATDKLTKTVNSPGGNETLTLDIGTDVFDKTVDDTADITEGTNLFHTSARVDARITLQKAAANGLATLDAAGLIPENQLPPLAITNTYVVADIAARDALPSIQEGDVAIVLDASADPDVLAGPATYIWDGTVWRELKSPTGEVTSVNGKTGAVTLSTTDIAEGTNLYYTDGRAKGAVSGGTGIDYNSGTGVFSINKAGAGIEYKKVEVITLVAGDISAKYHDLTSVPITATAVEVTPKGGIPQVYGDDFTVITNGSGIQRLNWNTLGMESVLAATDKLIVSYTY